MVQLALSNTVKSKFLPEPHGPWDGGDIHLSSPQPNANLHCDTIDMGLVYHMVCLFTLQLLGRYQSVLLDDRGTQV